MDKNIIIFDNDNGDWKEETEKWLHTSEVGSRCVLAFIFSGNDELR